MAKRYGRMRVPVKSKHITCTCLKRHRGYTTPLKNVRPFYERNFDIGSVTVLARFNLGSGYRFGNAKLKIKSPPLRPRSPPPEPTVTNCSPLTMYMEGEENTPAPVLNFQSNSPVFA